jgi:hypothetical protein
LRPQEHAYAGRTRNNKADLKSALLLKHKLALCKKKHIVALGAKISFQSQFKNLKFRGGGGEEDRTPDLRIANATLSQLSYPPNET